MAGPQLGAGLEPRNDEGETYGGIECRPCLVAVTATLAVSVGRWP